MLLDKLLCVPGLGFKLQDNHVALVENVYEASVLQLRLFYKGARDEIFLDMFEDEYRNEEVGCKYCSWHKGLILCTVCGGACAVLAAGGLHAPSTNWHTSHRHRVHSTVTLWRDRESKKSMADDLLSHCFDTCYVGYASVLCYSKVVSQISGTRWKRTSFDQPSKFSHQRWYSWPQ